LLDEVKEYLRIDGTDENVEIQGLINAAEAYLTNAGVIKDETNELYKLAVKMLVVNWYENRQPIGKADKLAFGLDSIITQLKYCYSTTV
jgi:uncharacterized phage protein (predicted DNA packaging)